MLFRNGTWARIVDFWIDGIFSYINIAIFASAIMFNVFNWLYSINDIKEFHDNIKVPNKIYHWILIFIQLIFTGISAFLFINSWILIQNYYLIIDYTSYIVQ